MDSDAEAYIAAVETADGQPLPAFIKNAIDAFVVGCKDDGIWGAIKSCCLLAGSATLAGALVPLRGDAPTNFYFVAENHNQLTGLRGNGTSKYLDSNRNNNADPQNSKHVAVFVSQVVSSTTGNEAFIGAGINEVGATIVGRSGAARPLLRNHTSDFFRESLTDTPGGFIGTSRSVSASFNYRRLGVTGTASLASETPLNQNITVFARASGTQWWTPSRLSFYSIGESLDLALLDSRVSTYMTAIAAGPSGSPRRRRMMMMKRGRL